MSRAFFDDNRRTIGICPQDLAQTGGTSGSMQALTYQQMLLGYGVQDVQPHNHLSSDFLIPSESMPPPFASTISPGTFPTEMGASDEIVNNALCSNSTFNRAESRTVDHPPTHTYVDEGSAQNDSPMSQTSQDTSNEPKKPRFKCEVEGCLYRGGFTTKASLKRHIKTQHVARGAFKCPMPGCHKSSNRKDNQEEHLRRKHCIYF